MIVKKQIDWVMGHALSAPYKGKCNQLHGHNWRAEFAVEGPLDDKGMVIDFANFGIMKVWINDNLDHRFLVKTNHLMLSPYFHSDDEFDVEINELGIVPIEFNPTSENMAWWLAHKCAELMNLEIEDITVTVWETCTSAAVYSGKEG